ncbi:MAG: hypothetical protein IJO32_02915 [Bacilli bacterium]|nr:hypothetical protein [Bacilli bacterium]
MSILPKELIDAGDGKIYDDGYRLVYFKNDNTYSIGAYCKTIEGFMIGFAECDPIIDEDDIPPFVSNDDILERSLDLFLDIDSVAIYKTDGTCIAKKERDNYKTK